MSFFVHTMVCGFSLYQILAFFLIYSCLGWCLEVIYAAVSTGQLVNRGFLNGPVCPIYGFGMIIVLFTLSPLADNLLLLYIGGVILPSVLELVGGWALYKLYHTRWWDYSDFPFNIGGYICLEFSLLWGVGTVVVMRAVHPVIAGFVEMVPQMVGFVLMCILYACYAADVVVTAFAASDLHENEPEWNIRTEHEGMFTEMGIKIKALIARKLPGDAAVTWIEPKVLKKRKAAEEAAAAAKEE